MNTALLTTRRNMSSRQFSQRKTFSYSRSQISCGRVKKSSFERAILTRKLQLQKMVTSTFNERFLSCSITAHTTSNCLHTFKLCVKRTSLSTFKFTIRHGRHFENWFRACALVSPAHSWQISRNANRIWPDLALGFAHKRSGCEINLLISHN